MHNLCMKYNNNMRPSITINVPIIIAMNGSDYIGVSTDLAFPTDGTDQCVTIVIIDSRIEEPNRIFSVIVTSSVSLEKLIVNVTILDKDSKYSVYQ